MLRFSVLVFLSCLYCGLVHINHSLYIEEGTASLVLQIVITFLFKDRSIEGALYSRLALCGVCACGSAQGGSRAIPAAAAVCRCRAPWPRRPRSAASVLGQNSLWQLLLPLVRGPLGGLQASSAPICSFK